MIPELLLSPSVDAGYYLFLAPLSPGAHDLHFHAVGCGITLDVTYRLTVAPKDQ